MNSQEFRHWIVQFFLAYHASEKPQFESPGLDRYSFCTYQDNFHRYVVMKREYMNWQQFNLCELRVGTN